MIGLVLSVCVIVWIIACILESRSHQSKVDKPPQKEIVPVSPKIRVAEDRGEVAENSHQRECPFCCEPIKDAAVKCPHCGESIGRHLYSTQKYSSWSIYQLEYFLEIITLHVKNAAFFEILDYVSRLSVLIAVIFWFADSGERIRQNQLQAWQIVSSGYQIGGGIATVQALELLNCTDASWFCKPVSLADVKLEKINLPNLDLHNAELSRADLSDTDLSHAFIIDANLSHADMSNADLSDAHLSGVNLDFATLNGANLSNADLSNADLNSAFLIDTHLNSADLDSAHLSHADLSRADLGFAHLGHADIGFADLHNTDLHNADLSHADLNHTDLDFANLSHADLRNADLRNADLSHADLSGANLNGADLRNAHLSSADLSGADLNGLIYNNNTIWPKGFSPR